MLNIQRVIDQYNNSWICALDYCEFLSLWLVKKLLFSINIILWRHAHQPGTICDVLNGICLLFLNMHLFISNDSQFVCIYLVITLILVVHIEHNPLGGLFNVNNHKKMLWPNKHKKNQNHFLIGFQCLVIHYFVFLVSVFVPVLRQKCVCFPYFSTCCASGEMGQCDAG